MGAGGWTLVGQVGGLHGDIHEQWLNHNVHVLNLKTTAIEDDAYSCIDAASIVINGQREEEGGREHMVSGKERWIDGEGKIDRQ